MAVDGDVMGDGGAVLTMWTIYYSPLDAPGLYVVRGFDIVRGLIEPVPRAEAAFMPSLELARECVPTGLYRLERSADDEPHIVETWM